MSDENKIKVEVGDVFNLTVEIDGQGVKFASSCIDRGNAIASLASELAVKRQQSIQSAWDAIRAMLPELPWDDFEFTSRTMNASGNSIEITALYPKYNREK